MFVTIFIGFNGFNILKFQNHFSMPKINNLILTTRNGYYNIKRNLILTSVNQHKKTLKHKKKNAV